MPEVSLFDLCARAQNGFRHAIAPFHYSFCVNKTKIDNMYGPSDRKLLPEPDMFLRIGTEHSKYELMVVTSLSNKADNQKPSGWRCMGVMHNIL